MDFKELVIGDIAEFNKHSYTNKLNWREIYYLDTGNVTENKINELKFFDLDKDKLPLRARRIPSKNSIVYSTVRPNQRHYGFLDDEIIENLLVSTGFAVIDVNTQKACPKYVYYYLIQDHITNYLQKIAEDSVSTYPAIKPSDIEELEIDLPSLNYQNKIASILSSFDQKIETNNKIIDNLEDQAQAIFKSWFIDFEPFQDGDFVESELGLIPKGWEVGTINDLGDIVGGSTPSKKKEEYYLGGDISWITPKDLATQKIKFVSKGSINITDEGLRKSSVKMMPRGTVLLSSRAPIGYIAIAKNPLTTNQGFKSIVPSESMGAEFVYCFLKQKIEYIKSFASGSTFKEISASVLKTIPIILPEHKIINKFRNMCRSFFSLQEFLEKENQRLAELRDILLPKLMSGEIDVSNIKIDAKEDGHG